MASVTSLVRAWALKKLPWMCTTYHPMKIHIYLSGKIQSILDVSFNTLKYDCQITGITSNNTATQAWLRRLNNFEKSQKSEFRWSVVSEIMDLTLRTSGLFVSYPNSWTRCSKARSSVVFFFFFDICNLPLNYFHKTNADGFQSDVSTEAKE